MRKILVSSDLTRKSDIALKNAGRLSEAFNTELKVLHVHKAMDASSVSYLFPEYENKMSELNKMYRDNLWEELNKQLERLELRPDRKLGEILFTTGIEKFDQITEKFKADLVIIPKLNEEFDSFLGGELSERLIRVSEQDVLIAQQEWTHNIDTIIVPFAINKYSVEALKRAEEFCKVFGAKIKLVHLHGDEKVQNTLDDINIKEDQTEVFEQIKKHIHELKKNELLESMFLIYCEWGKKEKLLQFIQSEKSDLVIMGASRVKGLQRLYLGSYCEYILRNGNENLLIVKG